MLLVPASLYVFSWVHRVAPAGVPAHLIRAFATLSRWTRPGATAGALLAGSRFGPLVEAGGGRPPFVGMGGVTLVLAAGAAGLIRDRPEGMGFPPVNPEHARRSVPTLREVLRGVPEVMRNPRTWPPILATCGIYSTFITKIGRAHV